MIQFGLIQKIYLDQDCKTDSGGTARRISILYKVRYRLALLLIT
jgi:hypothetical protein